MATTLAAHAPQTHMAAAKPAKRARDPRLDFFRGLGMFIILMAHIPWNTWTNWIPARFGFSDATEIFVFCSGAASAIAFWSVYQRKGWWTGTARILWRIWQIYWCHIGVFIAIVAVLAQLDALLETNDRHTSALNLVPFLQNPGALLGSLMTLTYVPNYFDILPMYLVLLALLPIMAALAQIKPILALALSVALYLLSSQPWLAFVSVPVIEIFNLPAEPWSNRTWFFNPFAWQLVFYTGFAFAAGWLPRPPVDGRLMLGAAAFLLLSIPLDPDGAPGQRLLALWDGFEPLRSAIRGFWSWSSPLWAKEFFGLLRYLHFLALAYLAWTLAGENGARLPSEGVAGRLVLVVRRVGQQSLAVFIASLLLARLLGAWLDHMGRNDLVAMAIVNLTGFAALILVAYVARYFRSQPWAAR